MVKEGYGYGLPLLVMAGGSLLLHLDGPAAVFFVLSALILAFFRDPERSVPTDPGVIVSPADGKVVAVADDDFEGRPMRRVSIFMSPLDVHVNRSPMAGTVRAVLYKPGRFRVASRAAASMENEQNVFSVEGEEGLVVVKQIAGLLARRIVFWKHPGDRLQRGERVGMIKFGSRVDLMVAPGVQLRVKVGDRVRAGSSVVAVSATDPARRLEGEAGRIQDVEENTRVI
jgi:phosphatidylserine decarboxylase